MGRPRPPVGTPMPRLEDLPFVQGSARYLDDLQMPGVLSVAFVRCPLGHARVRNLSFDQARSLPGFVAAFGPHDLAALGKPMPGMGDAKTHERTPAPSTGDSFCVPASSARCWTRFRPGNSSQKGRDDCT